MKCERVRCEQGAWRCRGDSDVVDSDSGDLAAEDVPPLPSRALFAIERYLVGAEGHFPREPRFVSAGEAAPVRALFLEAPHGKEQDGGDSGKPHVLDGELCPDQLILRFLKTVKVLGDTQVIGPPAKHVLKEGDDVGGLEDAAAAVETGEKIAEGHLVVKCGFFLEGEDPGLFDDGHEESAPGVFRCLEEPLELNIGGPEVFSLGAHGVGCVSGDAVVVRLEGGFHTFESPVPVLGLVIVFGEENVGEIDCAAWDIDRLGCVDEGLVEAFEVVVVGRANNGGEGCLGLRE